MVTNEEAGQKLRGCLQATFIYRKPEAFCRVSATFNVGCVYCVVSSEWSVVKCMIIILTYCDLLKILHTHPVS